MTISQRLAALNLISGQAVQNIFDAYYADILEMDVTNWSNWMVEVWARYPGRNNATNGKVFEGLLAVTFYRAGIVPLFMQAKLAFIPNVNFDFIAYSKTDGPIVFSAKTSLRERYKQAALEGVFLRQVHNNAKSYLLTLNSAEATAVNDKIDKNEVIGIDRVIDVRQDEFDNFIENLRNIEFINPGKVDIITASIIADQPRT